MLFIKEAIMATPLGSGGKKPGRSALIFAPPKTGKTRMIEHFPGKTLIIDTGDGGTSVLEDRGLEKKVSVEFVKSSVEFRRVIEGLVKNCPYDNIVVDTVTNIRKQDVRIKSDNFNPTSEKITKDIDWGGWADIKDTFLNAFYIMLTLTEVVNGSKNVIVNAWEATDKVTAKDGSEVTRFIPDTGHKFKDDMNPLTGLVDTVGRMVIGKEQERFISFTKDAQNPLLGDRYDRSFCKAKDLLNGKITSEEVVDVQNVQPKPNAETTGTANGTNQSNTKKIESEK